MACGRDAQLVLKDGTAFRGRLRGADVAAAGEVVFTTGMVGYNESITDPSYHGQILVFTYPLIGNYGVPDDALDDLGLPAHFESDRPQPRGIVVSTLCDQPSHRSSVRTVEAWLRHAGVCILSDVDTRALTQHLRDKGTMLGKIVSSGGDVPFDDPNARNLVAEVSTREPREYGADGPRVVLVDTGVKLSIIRRLAAAGARVLRVPWNYDFFRDSFHGLVLGNGPGDPKMVPATVELVRRALLDRVPTFGICLGHQLLALAAGADTYKLRFGHRGHNQPCSEVGTRRCYITSQNHGYAVRAETLPDGWREWLVNANDGTNEGIRHEYKPARSVQFHPEASPGPTDTAHLFARFLETLQ